MLKAISALQVSEVPGADGLVSRFHRRLGLTGRRFGMEWYPKALRTHILRFLGLKTILDKVFLPF